MRRGPAASPSSQMVTRRMDADLEAGVSGGERAVVICGARGMAEMQVNVLRGMC